MRSPYLALAVFWARSGRSARSRKSLTNAGKGRPRRRSRRSGSRRTKESEDNRVKVCLTDDQVLRLLCVGGRCNLLAVQSNQSMEKARDKRNSHYSDCPGVARRQ